MVKIPIKLCHLCKMEIFLQVLIFPLPAPAEKWGWGYLVLLRVKQMLTVVQKNGQCSKPAKKRRDERKTVASRGSVQSGVNDHS